MPTPIEIERRRYREARALWDKLRPVIARAVATVRGTGEPSTADRALYLEERVWWDREGDPLKKGLSSLFNQKEELLKRRLSSLERSFHYPTLDECAREVVREYRTAENHADETNRVFLWWDGMLADEEQRQPGLGGRAVGVVPAIATWVAKNKLNPVAIGLVLIPILIALIPLLIFAALNPDALSRLTDLFKALPGNQR